MQHLLAHSLFRNSSWMMFLCFIHASPAWNLREQETTCDLSLGNRVHRRVSQRSLNILSISYACSYFVYLDLHMSSRKSIHWTAMNNDPHMTCIVLFLTSTSDLNPRKKTRITWLWYMQRVNTMRWLSYDAPHHTYVRCFPLGLIGQSLRRMSPHISSDFLHISSPIFVA